MIHRLYSTFRLWLAPQRLRAEGTTPDYRFSLANERTFLAWIRTSLAFIAGGVALEAFGLAIQPGLRLAASLVLVVAGTILAVNAWYGWMRTERSMRDKTPLHSPSLGIVVAITVVLEGIILTFGILLA